MYPLPPFGTRTPLVLCAAFTTLWCCAQFTPGRLAILEMPFIWNGTSYTIPTTGGQLVIREYATDGTAGFSVAIPNTGPTMLVSNFQSAGASLTRSPSGDKLVFTGFTAASDGSFNLTTSSAAAVPRGIGTVDGAGNYARPFVTSAFFSGGSLKAACTDGVNYWAGGDNSGVCYLGPGTPVVINADVTTASDLQVHASGLLHGSNSNGLQRVGSGSPVTTAAQTDLFTMSLLQGFQMNPAGDVVYANNGSQIKKWVLSGGVWSNPYGFSAGTPLARIAVDWSGAQPIIYAVKNTPSSLVKFIDSGAPSAGVTLASTPAGAWYGIAFTPVGGCAEGTPCNDNNPNTTADFIRADCQCNGLSVTLAAKVYLEGPYDSATGFMSDALRTLPDFPLNEPYTALGMNPSGGAGSISASVLAVTGNNAITDWVLVELRDAATGTTVLLRQPALVQRDGDIVALDGTSALQLPALPDNYRVAVRHRNHLGAMTNTAFALSNAPAAVDLTSAATATWGTNARNTIGGVQVLWSGETLRNAQLGYTGSANDRDPILVAVGSTTPNNVITGYRTQDVNMNGSTAYTGSGNDRDPILVNVGSTTPNNIRVEQLP